LQFLPSSPNAEVTTAMEAGLADHIWTIEELVGVLESQEGKAA